MEIWTPGQPLPECADKHTFFNWITDTIAVTSYEAVKRREWAEADGVSFIVSIGHISPDYDRVYDDSGIKVFWYPSINDNEFISDETITLVINTIADCSEKGKTVVHCAAGVSRSPGFVATYLALKNNWTWEYAAKYVDERRPSFTLPETAKCLKAYIERHRDEYQASSA